MKNPLISIVIATKNRGEYCLESVKCIVNYVDNDSEIIIQDNSTTNELETLIAGLNDSRIRYNYCSNNVSIIENFNLAIEKATGKYVTVLGDDDSVLPYICSVVKWMDTNSIDTLSSDQIIDFIWPNPAIKEFNEGYLKIPHYSSSYKVINNNETLIQLLRNGIFNYQTYNLPRLYHGIVKNNLLTEIKVLTGHYFGGLTPDIYSTICLSFLSKKHVVCSYPFSVAGACPASASVANLQGKHSGLLIDAPHFKYRGNYSWNKLIPDFYSVDTIWAETALTAISEMNQKKYFEYFNVYPFLVHSIFSNKKYILKLVIKKSLVHYKKLDISPFVFYYIFFKTFVTICYEKIFSRIYKKNQQLIKFSYDHKFSDNMNACVLFILDKTKNLNKFGDV